MTLSKARMIADDFIAEFSPLCKRIEVAGSTRREKPDDIKDVEIVIIPEASKLIDLGGLITSYGGKFPSKYTSFWYNGRAKIDLFTTTPECWGCIYLIRTGSADFSKAIVTRAKRKDLAFLQGRLWGGGDMQALDTPEEADVFKALGLAYIEPPKRIDSKSIAMAAGEFKKV